MSNKVDGNQQSFPTLTDANRARERKVVIDPEKGPQNKKRKKVD